MLYDGAAIKDAVSSDKELVEFDPTKNTFPENDPPLATIPPSNLNLVPFHDNELVDLNHGDVLTVLNKETFRNYFSNQYQHQEMIICFGKVWAIRSIMSLSRFPLESWLG